MKEEIAIEMYETSSGKCPYLEWEIKLGRKIKDYVGVRLARIRLGYFGDCKKIEGVKGLFEIRMHIDKGFRIYFMKKGSKIIILLCAGSKSSQKRDIARAKKYWEDCLN